MCILQAVWALQTNEFPYYKDKAFQGNNIFKKYGRYLDQSGWRYKSLSLFYFCYKYT